MKKNLKNKIKKNNKQKSSIQTLKNSRNGGQNALMGYSYQFLYSSYLILSSSSDAYFQIEGVEDIDFIKKNDSSSEITHIQLKYSTNKQDASFLLDVLKNFLEVYLLDNNRSFKLVYDFAVAQGNLSKLFTNSLDDKSINYWKNVIMNIKESMPTWNWSIFDFDEFISKISFENVKKISLANEIEKKLIDSYNITTGNVSLFANSIKVFCFEKMMQRAYVTKADVDRQIQLVIIDISKGAQNPSHSWIRKLDFSKTITNEDANFYEGKKTTPADIANELPVKRQKLEQEIISSISENTVTIIKASSGQGKTTLALRVSYILQNEYTTYQLLWCNETKELGNIILYFKARIKLGEKILILIDNLDSNLSKWNHLVQLLQQELNCHYKLLITSREIDWYNFSGDLSNIHSVKIIKPTLEEKDAREIFDLFKKNKHLHPSITNWQKSWNMIADKQLLIEYVYLLSHGEMLSERINSQISEIGRMTDGKVKFEILRKVCFADLCNIKLRIDDLYANQSEISTMDFGEILKSMESEFLVHVNAEYIEGLHPIRSKHIIDRLHEFDTIDNTAISVIKIARRADLSILFSHLPEFDLNQNEFFNKVIETIWNENDLSNYIDAIKGLFSGNVMKYFLENQNIFNDANNHGGLFILSTEVCPFVKFKEFDVEISTLDEMSKILPENNNIKYLCELRNHIPVCNLQETYVYTFCECLYKKLLSYKFSEIKDIESYAFISEWIYNIDSQFNLSLKISLDNIWLRENELTLETISTLMYGFYCGNKDKYIEFVEKNLDLVINYLKRQTKSYKIFINKEEKEIHVEYILRLSNINEANEQSVSRLKYICKTLPIFDFYCADALKPSINFLSVYKIPDDSHKRMPIRNLVITFHQDIASLWDKTIMSNYEFDTVEEWLNHWFDVRKTICLIIDKCCACIYKILDGKKLGSLAKEFDDNREKYIVMTTGEKLYPKENRPFEEKSLVTEELTEIKNRYFQHIQNFINQFVEFLKRDEKIQGLAMINLTNAKSNLEEMQIYFEKIASEHKMKESHLKICSMEIQNINQLIIYCSYYKTHLPDRYFNKYKTKQWYDEYCSKERQKAENSLRQLQSKYIIDFPYQTYTNNFLEYYPIIVHNFDIKSEDNIMEWLCSSITFSDTIFDYLVVLFHNEQGKLNNRALQFPKKTFEAIKKALEMEDDSLFENITPPYPIDVDLKMLNCFIKKYDLTEEKSSNFEVDSIESVAEELWIYSKIRELLIEKSDDNYLISEMQNIQNNISKMLNLLKVSISTEDFNWITEIYNSVLSGENFDNTLFNKVIEHFI